MKNTDVRIGMTVVVYKPKNTDDYPTWTNAMNIFDSANAVVVEDVSEGRMTPCYRLFFPDIPKETFDKHGLEQDESVRHTIFSHKWLSTAKETVIEGEDIEQEDW